MPSDVERLTECRAVLAETAALLLAIERRLHVEALGPVVATRVSTDRLHRGLVLEAAGLGRRATRG